MLSGRVARSALLALAQPNCRRRKGSQENFRSYARTHRALAGRGELRRRSRPGHRRSRGDENAKRNQVAKKRNREKDIGDPRRGGKSRRRLSHCGMKWRDGRLARPAGRGRPALTKSPNRLQPQHLRHLKPVSPCAYHGKQRKLVTAEVSS